jgi:hypothetical protein
MGAPKMLLAGFVFMSFGFLVDNAPAHAAPSDISFTINDTDPPLMTGPSPLNIAGTYNVGGKTITIAPYGGNAIIEFDEGLDSLRMKNVEITTSTAPIDNVKFSFWRTFASLTTGVATYSVSGNGVFSRSVIGTDPNDWISLRGWVEATLLGSPTVTSPPPNPPNCLKPLTSCATSNPGTWTFNLNSPNGGFKVNHSFNPLPAGSDDLKAAFWIHLQKNTDRLDIGSSPGIRVKFGTASGEGLPCPDEGVTTPEQSEK